MKSRSDNQTLSQSDVLLGVDTGGTNTTVVVGRRDLTVLARADGPGAAMRPEGAEQSAVVIAETARRAAERAGVQLPAHRLVVGAAGAGRAQEQRALEAALVAHGVAHQARAMSDGEIALAAAFGGGSGGGAGIFLNAGTGSIAFARDRNGRVHRSGGHGWQLGDEGGGYWLGRRALQAAGRAYDGRGEGSTLLSRLLAALGLADFDALVRWATLASPAQVAALAPQLLNAAREGEALAQPIVEEAARDGPCPAHRGGGGPRARRARAGAGPALPRGGATTGRHRRRAAPADVTAARRLPSGPDGRLAAGPPRPRAGRRAARRAQVGRPDEVMERGARCAVLLRHRPRTLTTHQVLMQPPATCAPRSASPGPSQDRKSVV